MQIVQAMLALRTWCGSPAQSEQQNVKVFSKLSGAFVCHVRPCWKDFKDAYSMLHDIQDQVAKLLVHPKLPSRYLALFVESKRLTSSKFPFVKHLDVQEGRRVFDALGGTRRVDVMWDEDFSYAKNVLQAMNLTVKFVGGQLTVKNMIELYLEDALPPELEVFGFQEDVEKIELLSNTNKLGGVELFPKLKHLVYPGDETVNHVDFVELAKSKTLHDLDINLNGLLDKQVGLMTNLTYLVISACKPTLLPTEIGLLTKLTNLSLYNQFEGNLPSEVGNLQGLRRLVVSKTDITSAPPELCDLAALFKMELDHNTLMKGSFAQGFSKLESLVEFSLYKTPLVDVGSMDGWKHLGGIRMWRRRLFE